MTKLTARQAEIFNYIKSYIKTEGMSPTSVEVGEHFGMYPNGAYAHIKALIKKGALEVKLGKMRSMRIVKGYKVRVKS